jgi:hypothetical protein
MPRRRLTSRVQHLIDQLALNATEELISSVGRELIPAVSNKADPARSLGAYLRRFRERGISESACEALRLSVVHELAPHPIPMPAPSEIGASEAARLTGQSLKTLLHQLKSPEHRRLYGWPIWRGNSWGFVRDAVDPRTSRQFLATLPLEEPPAITALLPSWCVRGCTTDHEVSLKESRERTSE